MRRVLVSIVALFVFAGSPLAADEIGIVVSPNVINIASESTVVTVHTDIPFFIPADESVYLNDVLITSWKADSRGFFVAKFLARAVKEAVEVEENETTIATLMLVVKTTEGESSGTDEVKVINVKAKK
jgi:hypothetical protein